ncbi:hypothetical protein [Kitasatospora albolonga]|uniref:hypothetical protein n=1 Tax=Kitasatospora albolonga TaxID=68173 RepID=UPI0031ED9E1E
MSLEVEPEQGCHPAAVGGQQGAVLREFGQQPVAVGAAGDGVAALGGEHREGGDLGQEAAQCGRQRGQHLAVQVGPGERPRAGGAAEQEEGGGPAGRELVRGGRVTVRRGRRSVLGGDVQPGRLGGAEAELGGAEHGGAGEFTAGQVDQGAAPSRRHHPQAGRGEQGQLLDCGLGRGAVHLVQVVDQQQDGPATAAAGAQEALHRAAGLRELAAERAEQRVRAGGAPAGLPADHAGARPGPVRGLGQQGRLAEPGRGDQQGERAPARVGRPREQPVEEPLPEQDGRPVLPSVRLSVGSFAGPSVRPSVRLTACLPVRLSGHPSGRSPGRALLARSAHSPQRSHLHDETPSVAARTWARTL